MGVTVNGIVFQSLFSVRLLPVRRNAVDFCPSTVYSVTLFRSPGEFGRFWWMVLSSPQTRSVCLLSVMKRFILVLILVPSISFSCLVALAGVSGSSCPEVAREGPGLTPARGGSRCCWRPPGAAGRGASVCGPSGLPRSRLPPSLAGGGHGGRRSADLEPGSFFAHVTGRRGLRSVRQRVLFAPCRISLWSFNKISQRVFS